MITHYAGQSDEIAEIFHHAIYQLAGEHYTSEELQAWAGVPSSGPINYQHWHWRCELKRPFVFVDDGQTCGFLELDPDGHIDCHYVHPSFARRGIGGQLLSHAVQVAKNNSVPELRVEASHLAKGLYLKHGFEVQQENQVRRGGVTIDNWLMKLTLGDSH